MMNYYGYDGWGMMQSGLGLACLLTWLVVMFDLVLVGIWLWKQINK